MSKRQSKLHNYIKFDDSCLIRHCFRNIRKSNKIPDLLHENEKVNIRKNENETRHSTEKVWFYNGDPPPPIFATLHHTSFMQKWTHTQFHTWREMPGNKICIADFPNKNQAEAYERIVRDFIGYVTYSTVAHVSPTISVFQIVDCKDMFRIRNVLNWTEVGKDSD